MKKQLTKILTNNSEGPMRLHFLLFSLIFFVTFNLLQAQTSDLEQTLAKITGDASKAYVAPISSAFGANLNSGWVHSAPKATKFSFDLEVGFVAMATLFGSSNQTFASSGSFRFNSAQAEQLIPPNITGSTRTSIKNEILSRDFTVSISGPTIVGKKTDSIKVKFPGAVIQGQTLGAKELVLPVTGYLEELPALPLVVPQVSLGTVFGTQVSLRYLPEFEVSPDLGKFKYTGFGIQHNPTMWLPFSLPVNVSVGYFTQSLEVGKIFKTSASMFGVFASKRFGPGALNIEPYAGFTLESSSIDVEYDVTYDTPTGPSPAKIKYSLEGENSTRVTIGATLKLLLVGLSVDYSIAKYNTVSASLNIKI
jgi:hypothetical protein